MTMHRLGVLIAFAAALAVPPAAGADTFFAEPGGNGPVPCVESDPCSVESAQLASIVDGDGLPHTIRLAAGLYTGAFDRLSLTEPNEAGITVEGAGAGSTILRPTTNQSVLFADSPAAGATVRGVTLDGQNSSHGGVVLLSDAAAGSPHRLESVSVLSKPASNQAAIVSFGGTAEPSRVVISGSSVLANGTTPAIHGRDADLSVERTAVRTAASVSSAPAVHVEDGRTHIVASTLISDQGVSGSAPLSVVSGPDAGTNGRLTVDDSLLIGGEQAVQFQLNESPDVQSLFNLVVRQTTVDSAFIGASDGAPWLETITDPTGDTLSMRLENNVFADLPGAAQSSSMSVQSCTHNEWVAGVDSSAMSACNPGTSGNTSVGGPASYGQLFSLGPFTPGFTDPIAYYEPLPTSPLLDSGSPDPLAPASGDVPAEPQQDASGRPRIVDGNLDCAPARDKGALERQDRQQFDCSSPLPTDPPPVISSASLRPKRVSAGRRVKLRLTLSEAAQVDVEIKRRSFKRKLAFDGASGDNTFRLKTKRLRPGRYGLLATAKDPAGQVSDPVRLRFRVGR